MQTFWMKLDSTFSTRFASLTMLCIATNAQIKIDQIVWIVCECVVKFSVFFSCGRGINFVYKPWYRIWLKIEKHKKRWNEIQWTNFVYISNVVDRPWRVQTGQCISWCDYNKDITNPLLFIINPTDSVRCLYFIRLSYQKQCKLEENHVSQNEKE